MSKILVELTKDEFDKKIASNQDNTEYTIGGDGEGYVGTPDILYNQVIFVSDENFLYTRGNYYGKNYPQLDVSVTSNHWDYIKENNPNIVAVGNGKNFCKSLCELLYNLTIAMQDAGLLKLTTT